ncbi:sensor histidine kinase [Aquimarina sp. RZ0]|uniref:ATP-binding protein n=1 Tax=Aquimarina sp. RZ0 TaxID=2607730 RepID=UPI0011F35CC4|nr:sensor histidine kinase [Aquimarina sp. RZ0]KAA1242901.1 histidine kinase [Aquimarina sp. RZ0]
MEPLHFKTNVQLKSIIGKDLINDDNIAILELVKNSFDADSKRVTVEYVNIKGNNDQTIDTFSNSTSRLVIQDDGLGMDIDDVQNKWLNIAYSEKKENTKQHKRLMAGAKGVGRFSCDRLGEYLILYAKKKQETRYIKLTIDWKKFEIQDESKEIQSIPIKYEYLSKNELNNSFIKPFDQGVALEIIKLRSAWVYPPKNVNEKKWDVSKLIKLKKYLEKLINPNQAFESDDFGIYVSAPEFETENELLPEHDRFIGKVENKIFDKLDFKSTSIEAKTIDNGESLYVELKDKGETIFWIKEKNSFFPFIKNARISLYYLNPYAKAFFTRQTGIQAVNYGSVFLFVNGFRIPPYGDVGDDWLGLDVRKGQGINRRIGVREIVGHIEILDDHNDFQIISSREGIVRNDSYKKLTNSEQNNSLFFKTLTRLERYVVDGLAWDSSIYDVRDPKFKELEQKIIAGETEEEDLQYRESSEIKKGRIYGAIHSIIAAKPDDVIKLYINEDLILNKIEEERKRSEREFEQLIEDFDNKKIDVDTLSRILERKALQNKELEKQIRKFSKYSTTESTTKALLELQKYRDTVEKQTKLIEELQRELQSLRNEKEKAENKVQDYKDRVEQAENDLSIEKQKSLYLLATRRTLSPDADGLIHTIKINNIEIRDGIENLVEDIHYGVFEKGEILRRLGNIKVNAERSLKLTEIASRSDFNEDIEKRNIDIIKYVQEYLDIYGDTFTTNNLEFEVDTNQIEYIKTVSILNLSIVLDNMISNAVKWGADKIAFVFKKGSANKLSLFISDNGNGLSKKFAKNSDRIFELSVRETSPTYNGGSGIGLYYSRKLLKDMGCEIEFVGNNQVLSGATFKLTF